MDLLEKIKNNHSLKNDIENKNYGTYMYLQENDVRIQKEGSKIIEFLKGKVIFLTGGTGFLGKLLIEKLLRACDEIDTIYVLTRAKKGKSCEDRLDALLDEKIFCKLEEIFPKFRSKIRAIKGDVGLPGLGISDTDRKMLAEKVNILYHVAATTRFNEKINLAVDINIKGTIEIVKLAKECKDLVSFVYVGTAYSNCDRTEIREEIYEPKISAKRIIEFSENYCEEELEQMTPILLSGLPNTYSLTKQISEDIIKTEAVGLPVCIFRPAIVVSTAREPLKAWIDNVFGPIGYCAGVSAGLIKVINADGNVAADIIPADFSTNGLIAVSYKTAMDRNKILKDIPVYNYVSSKDNKVTWKFFMDVLQKFGSRMCSNKSIMRPFCIMSSSKTLLHLYIFLLHLIPGFLMDAGLYITGKKTKIMKAYGKIHQYFEVMGFFSNREWTFKNENIRCLWNSLEEADKKAFPFNIKDVDWQLYLILVIHGIREYILQDPLVTLQQGRDKYRRSGYILRIIQVILVICLCKIAIIFFL